MYIRMKFADRLIDSGRYVDLFLSGSGLELGANPNLNRNPNSSACGP